MTDARELAHIFYTEKISQTPDCIHLVDYYLKVVQATGASDVQASFDLPLQPRAADSVATLLARHKVEPGNYAVFIPGSAHSEKCWPVASFAALADRIAPQFGFSIVATGMDSERAMVHNLVNLANVPITNLAGLTDLSGLMALLKSAKIVVSNDTGPGHIAAALGTPLVLIFGRSNPLRVAPYGRSHCVVAIEPESRGLKYNSNDPKHDVRAITVQQVYQKVCEQLNRKP